MTGSLCHSQQEADSTPSFKQAVVGILALGAINDPEKLARLLSSNNCWPSLLALLNCPATLFNSSSTKLNSSSTISTPHGQDSTIHDPTTTSLHTSTLPLAPRDPETPALLRERQTTRSCRAADLRMPFRDSCDTIANLSSVLGTAANAARLVTALCARRNGRTSTACGTGDRCDPAPGLDEGLSSRQLVIALLSAHCTAGLLLGSCCTHASFPTSNQPPKTHDKGDTAHLKFRRDRYGSGHSTMVGQMFRLGTQEAGSAPEGDGKVPHRCAVADERSCDAGTSEVKTQQGCGYPSVACDRAPGQHRLAEPTEVSFGTCGWPGEGSHAPFLPALGVAGRAAEVLQCTASAACAVLTACGGLDDAEVLGEVGAHVGKPWAQGLEGAFDARTWLPDKALTSTCQLVHLLIDCPAAAAAAGLEEGTHDRRPEVPCSCPS